MQPPQAYGSTLNVAMTTKLPSFFFIKPYLPVVSVSDSPSDLSRLETCHAAVIFRPMLIGSRVTSRHTGYAVTGRLLGVTRLL